MQRDGEDEGGSAVQCANAFTVLHEKALSQQVRPALQQHPRRTRRVALRPPRPRNTSPVSCRHETPFPLASPHVTEQVVLGCWCPTMDLLALVADDGQLGVHRLGWEKLWVAVPDTPITALTWRPDGAVGEGKGGGDVAAAERTSVLVLAAPWRGLEQRRAAA